MFLSYAYGIFILLLGLCVGSFLNVCIYRLPKNESIIKPRSFCPKCKVPVKWYDNIPLVGYILLSGKCRDCGEKISLRYPVVELITGAVFLTLYIVLGPSLGLAKYLFLFCLLIVVSFIDIDYHAIPAYLCLIGIIGGLVFSLGVSIKLFNQGIFDIKAMPIVFSLRGLIFGLGFTYLFKFFGDAFVDFYLNIRKKESIEGERESLGLGDVDFMGMVGVFLGVKGALLVFFIAPFFAVIYSIIAFIFKKSHLIPYLPYLSLATIVVYFWGNKILSFLF